MLGLYLSLALLGLAAVDPIGIGIMPILLLQKHPYRRALIFLSGSFIALVVMGFAFAKGLGDIVLTFQQQHQWLVPATELIAAAILMVIAIMTIIDLRRHKAAPQPAARLMRLLTSGDLPLLWLGILVVAIQSLVDVVFIIAMVRSGEFGLSDVELGGAVTIYALTALLLQIGVVVAFIFAPSRHKARVAATVNGLVTGYARQLVIGVSLALALILAVLACRDQAVQCGFALLALPDIVTT